MDPAPFMTYAPFLPECAAGSLEPRHVVVPHRDALRRGHALTGSVLALSHAHHSALIQPPEGPAFVVRYDHVLLAPGSVTRAPTIPGLHDGAMGFRSIDDAAWLRDHVLSRLDLAAQTHDADARKAALTFTVIGGGFAGSELVGEMEDLTRAAVRRYRGQVALHEVRWVLVDQADRLLPEVSADLAGRVADQLRRRGVSILLGRRLESLIDGVVRLDDGVEFRSETVIWTGGVQPNPMLARTDLPRDAEGRVRVTAELRVAGCPGAWAAGDCAAVPDPARQPGAVCPPSAQHAFRQARLLAANVVRSVRGEAGRPYQHKYVGAVATLGRYKGVAEIRGVQLRGFVAWWLHRTYHLLVLPSRSRRLRVVTEWTVSLFTRRDVVPLGRSKQPRPTLVATDAAADGPIRLLRPAPYRSVRPSVKHPDDDVGRLRPARSSR